MSWQRSWTPLIAPLCAIAVWLSADAFAFQAARVSAEVPVRRVRLTAPPVTDASPHDGFRVDSPLVLVPAQVTTRAGTPITGLRKNSFQIFEDHDQQEIAYFSLDDTPVSVGLLFDSSGSMEPKMHKAAEAAESFFRTANALDEFFLVEFGERAKLTVPFTSDTVEIHRRILRARPFGRTSLLDAVRMAMLRMKDARYDRKVIVILSDGGDNHSHVTAGEIRQLVMESDVQVYAMGLFEARELKQGSPEEKNGPKLLDELAELSGGRHYRIDKLQDLPPISERISVELRSQYLLGYHPTNASRDGKYRRIKVTVDAGQVPECRLLFRRGYRAPEQ